MSEVVKRDSFFLVGCRVVVEGVVHITETWPMEPENAADVIGKK